MHGRHRAAGEVAVDVDLGVVEGDAEEHPTGRGSVLDPGGCSDLRAPSALVRDAVAALVGEDLEARHELLEGAAGPYVVILPMPSLVALTPNALEPLGLQARDLG